MGEIIFIAAAAVILLAAILIKIQELPYFRKKQIGAEGEEKTNAVLRKFAKKHNCLMMTNVFLPLYDGTCEIDHILFGKFGAAVIETKNISGELSGTGRQLVHTVGKNSYTMYNPALQNETHVKNIQYHLTKAGYKNVPVYSFVVFTSDNIKFPDSVGIRLSELEKNLKKLPDSKCDCKKLFMAIKQKEVKNPVDKIIHNIQNDMKNKSVQ